MEAATPTTFNEFSSPELPVRKEVRDFMRAAEILLSPVLLDSDLTDEECAGVRMYVMALSHAKRPWSKGLPIKYT